jgi:hypothetical protein
LIRSLLHHIGSAPINAPPPTRHFYPEELFDRRSTRVVVKHGGSFVKSSGVGRSCKAELLAIEVMTELVAKRAQERAEGRDLLAHGSASPYANSGIA